MYLHIDRLKARILPPELADGVNGTRLDARVGPMAAGIATLFDSHCGRTFARAVGAVESFPVGQAFVKLARYPVEEIDSVSLVHPDGTSTTITTDISRLSKSAGLVHFLYAPGTEDDSIVVTYTGGYYIDTSEDGDGTQPGGSTALPADLIDAWVLQCDHEARARKFFGTVPQSSTNKKDVAGALPADYDLIPRVEKVLRQYARLC